MDFIKYSHEPVNTKKTIFRQLPSFGNNLSEDPHSVVIAHVLKVHIIHLVSRQKKRNILS